MPTTEFMFLVLRGGAGVSLVFLLGGVFTGLTPLYYGTAGLLTLTLSLFAGMYLIRDTAMQEWWNAEEDDDGIDNE